MSIPNYRVNLSFDAERKLFHARAPELEHCHGEGPTRTEAIARLEEEIKAQVDNMHAHGSNPPPPVDEAQLSGELRAKISQTLHRDLLWQARQEGVELDQLLAELLAASLESRKAARPRYGNRPGPADAAAHDNIGNTLGGNRGSRGYGGRYNPAVLDDRANFIEYVRNLDQGQQSGYNRGPGSAGGSGGRRDRRRGGPGGGRGPGGGNGAPGGGGSGRTG